MRISSSRFLKAARDDRWYAPYSVALALGLRRGEALALRWVDVDLVDGVLRVRQSLQRTGGQLRFGPVKTDGSERAVALPAGLVDVLRGHRVLQRTKREAAGDRWQEHGLLFTTKIGTPIEPRNINRHLDQLCERAGVRRIRVHDLRHVGVSRGGQKGQGPVSHDGKPAPDLLCARRDSNP
ncbi:site-specific integrase [Micromonospora musae]|uniref:Site-specific integrase n=1 Tax=Micromonospora musae TaxID=1894970 RepID=A0A3A9XX51_9ACTN|nr:site-specific integrase [Micromonospora musae]